MIIDFHAHIYPEKIAEKASETIGNFYGIEMKYHGHTEELLENGSKIGTQYYVVHSTATKPEQVESINNYIIGECEKHKEFIGFGTIHPDYKDFKNELKRIKELGLKGIKLHPDFQKFQADDIRMDDIYAEIAKLKMPVLIHAGDSRYDYSTPKRIRAVIEKHPDLILVAAHFGGYSQWNDSFKFLVGKNVYFDTSSTLWSLDKKTAKEMIKTHGVNNFLFGTDFPMWDACEELERFKALDLSSEDEEKILYLNAKQLLGL